MSRSPTGPRYNVVPLDYDDQPYRSYHPYSAGNLGTSPDVVETTHQSKPTNFSSSSQDVVNGPYLPPQAEEHRDKRVTLPILALALPSFLLVAVIGIVAPVIYIFSVHSGKRENGSIITDAPLASVLTITQVGTNVVMSGIAVAMIIDTYRLAAHWARYSRSQSQDRPTPLQYGLLVNTLQGSSVVTLLTSILRQWQYHRTRRYNPVLPNISSLLLSSTRRLAWLLFLGYTITVVDTIFHVQSEPAIITSIVPFNSSSRALSTSPLANNQSASSSPRTQSAQFSRRFNQTMCDLNSKVGWVISAWDDLCGLAEGGSTNMFLESSVEGQLVMNNASDVHAVALTDDQTAILVPVQNDLPQDATFTANSLGLKMSCRSITTECISNDTAGCDACLNLNCTGPTKMGIPSESTNRGSDASGWGGIVNSTGDPSAAWNVDSNPFGYGAVVINNVYQGRGVRDEYGFLYDNVTGFFTQGGNVGAVNVLACSIQALNVTYRYKSPATYTLVHSEPSDILTTRRLATMVDSQVPGTTAVGRIIGQGLDGGNTMSFAQSYAVEFARELIGMSAPAIEPADAVSYDVIETVTGSKLKFAPFVILLILYGSFSLTILFLAANAIIAARSMPFVHLARSRLTDTLFLVHSQFGRMDAAQTWRDSSVGLFKDETEDDRLNVGPTEPTGRMDSYGHVKEASGVQSMEYGVSRRGRGLGF